MKILNNIRVTLGLKARSMLSGFSAFFKMYFGKIEKNGSLRTSKYRRYSMRPAYGAC